MRFCGASYEKQARVSSSFGVAGSCQPGCLVLGAVETLPRVWLPGVLSRLGFARPVFCHGYACVVGFGSRFQPTLLFRDVHDTAGR